MKVDNYSNRKDRRLALKQNGERIFGLNKPYVAPRQIVKRGWKGSKEVTIVEKRTDKKKEKIIGKEINN